MTCFACGQVGVLESRKIVPILPGWPAKFGEPRHQYGPFHGPCYQAWYRKVYRGLAEIDRSLNECRFFVRTKGTEFDGVYERDGIRLACKSWWRGDEMERAYPQLRGSAWWEPRWVDTPPVDG